MNLIQLRIRVMLIALLSMLLPVTVAAHEVQPAVADVTVTPEMFSADISVAIEPLIAGVDLGAVEDTNESPLSSLNDRLRALPPAELEAALRDAWPGIAAQMTLTSGDQALEPVLGDVIIPEVGDVEIRRDSTITVTAPLPEGDAPAIYGFNSSLGGLILRHTSGEGTYEALLTGGALSDPMPRDGVAEQSISDLASRYIVSGFIHVIPDGLDHILFVLGLFFYALAWRAILWQVTSFTIAHTTTLALATMGAITIPDNWMWLVETIIAGSILWIAVENIIGGKDAKDRQIGWGRIGVVFVFGLVHGLGFASVLSEFGVGGNLVATLAFFTIGLEIGHLTVIAAAFLLLGVPFGSKSFYRPAIVIPGSLIIGAIGAYWVLNRIGLVGDVPFLT